MKSYRYIIEFEETKYYSDNPNDYTKLFWNEFIYPKGLNKKVLKAEVKKLLKRIINEKKDSEIRIKKIIKEVYYNPSWLFTIEEYQKIKEDAIR